MFKGWRSPVWLEAEGKGERVTGGRWRGWWWEATRGLNLRAGEPCSILSRAMVCFCERSLLALWVLMEGAGITERVSGRWLCCSGRNGWELGLGWSEDRSEGLRR